MDVRYKKKTKKKNYLPFLIFTIIALGMHSLLLNKISGLANVNRRVISKIQDSQFFVMKTMRFLFLFSKAHYTSKNLFQAHISIFLFNNTLASSN